jgi:Spy/CpxP family protein refolding chaperone
MKAVKLSFMTAVALSTLVALAPLSRGQDSKDNKDTAKPDRPPAGQPQRRGGGGAQAFDRIAERLKLTDDQKTKLQPIFQEEMTKMRDLRQDTTLTAEQRREKVRELREQYLAKMKPTLTTEQFDQLKKMREQAPRGPRGPRQGGDGNPPAAPEKPAPDKQ